MGVIRGLDDGRTISVSVVLEHHVARREHATQERKQIRLLKEFDKYTCVQKGGWGDGLEHETGREARRRDDPQKSVSLKHRDQRDPQRDHVLIAKTYANSRQDLQYDLDINDKDTEDGHWAIKPPPERQGKHLSKLPVCK